MRFRHHADHLMRDLRIHPSATWVATVLVLSLLLLAAVPVLELDRLDLVTPHLFPRPVPPAGLRGDELLFTTLTLFGAGVGLVCLVTATIAALILQGRRDATVFVLAVVIGASLIGKLIKAIVAAPRPPLGPGAATIPSVPHVTILAIAALIVAAGSIASRRREALITAGILVALYAIDLAGDAAVPLRHGFDSFPSGHAVGSMAFAAAFVLAGPVRGRWRTAAIVLVAVYAVGIGVSRVYLGVHYPADVMAGWCIAIAWASACYVAADRILKMPLR